MIRNTILFIILLCLNSSAEDIVIKDHHNNLSSNFCHRTITLKQILQLLNAQPCQSIFLQVHQRIHKRNPDAGNLDIHALQTTINDHRTMINYLINNSINATYVGDAISSHHSKTGPILSSWRDIIDICTVTFLLGYIIYYGIFRTGFGPCDKLISCCCRPVIARAQNEQQVATTLKREKSHKQRPPLQSSLASLEDDITRINHGYLSA